MRFPHTYVRATTVSLLMALFFSGTHSGAANSLTASLQTNPTGPVRSEQSASQPWVNLSAIQALDTQDTGQGVAGAPISLAAADLQADGAPDLMAGYADQNGGWLVIYPGNPAGGADAPFLGQGQAIRLPLIPNWLGSGDFNADGYIDIVAAAADAAQLAYLPGNGAGKFGEIQPVILPGRAAALAVGELDRQDGAADVAVGLENGQLLVFAGGPTGLAEVRYAVQLPAAAEALAIGQLDDDFPYDLAWVAGSELGILHGQDQLAVDNYQPDEERINLGYPIADLALCDFLVGDAQAAEIAVLSNAGDLRLYNRDGQAVPGASYQVAGPAAAGASEYHLQRAKTSTLPGDDLVLLDRAGQALRVLHASRSMDAGGNLQLATIDTGSRPLAALAVAINADALTDLVLLTEGSSAPQYILTAAVHVFVVNSTWDIDDDTIGDGKCDVSGPSLNWGLCTLRAAIQEANASAGLDEIQLAFRYSPNSPLPQITEALLLKGTDPAAEINGSSAGNTYGLHFVSSASTVQDIKVREFQWPAIYLMSGGNHLITGVQLSDNLDRGITIATGSNQLVNSVIVNNAADGVAVINSSGNTLAQNKIGILANGNAAGNRASGVYLNLAANTIIGGLAANRNVISANKNGGIQIGGSAAGSLVQGNYIGTSLDGLQAKGNLGRGGVNLENTSSITVGGATSSYRNVIGGNSNGVTVQSNAATKNLIRNNYIGVDANGTGRLANTVHAIKIITTGTNNSVQVKDNVIGGDANSGHGVYIFS